MSENFSIDESQLRRMVDEFYDDVERTRTDRPQMIECTEAALVETYWMLFGDKGATITLENFENWKGYKFRVLRFLLSINSGTIWNYRN